MFYNVLMNLTKLLFCVKVYHLDLKAEPLVKKILYTNVWFIKLVKVLKKKFLKCEHF